MTSSAGSTTGTQAVHRAAQLLTRVVQADEPASFGELHEDCGLSRSTTSRLLAALEANHLIERDSNGAFGPGALFALHAARNDPGSQIARVADPVLRDVSADTGETVNLAIARGDTVVQIAQIDSTYVLGARDWMEVAVPPHCSALGKVLYAWGGLAAPSGRLAKLTAHSVGTAAALERELRGVRDRGYATTREELELGLNAAAAPVLGADGAVVAALGVSGPSGRLDQNLDDVGELLTKHADSLSRILTRRTKGTTR